MAIATKKILVQIYPDAAQLVDAFVSPPKMTTVVSTVVITNHSASASSFRLSIAAAGEADAPKHYLFRDAEIEGNETISLSLDLLFESKDTIRFYSTDGTISFAVIGTQKNIVA